MKKTTQGPSRHHKAKLQFPIDGYTIANNLAFQRGVYLLVVASLSIGIVNYWPNSEGKVQPRVFSVAHGVLSAPQIETRPVEVKQVSLLAELVEEEKEIVYSPDNPSGQYALVIASMKNIEAAFALLGELQNVENAEIVEDFSQNQTWFRVVASRSIRKSRMSRLAKRLEVDTWLTSLSERAKVVRSFE